MRDYLIKHGAEFRFQTCLKDIQIKENALHALVTEDDTVIPADVAILALGHSARDTFTPASNGSQKFCRGIPRGTSPADDR